MDDLCDHTWEFRFKKVCLQAPLPSNLFYTYTFSSYKIFFLMCLVIWVKEISRATISMSQQVNMYFLY